MGQATELVRHILWGVLVTLFIAVMIFALILEERIRRKTQGNSSIFSPLPLLRSFGTWELYVFILLTFVVVGLGMAMKFLKDHGF